MYKNEDEDPILQGLYAALNLQQGIKYYTDRVKGLDGPSHFEKIREAIQVRRKELESNHAD